MSNLSKRYILLLSAESNIGNCRNFSPNILTTVLLLNILCLILSLISPPRKKFGAFFLEICCYFFYSRWVISHGYCPFPPVPLHHTPFLLIPSIPPLLILPITFCMKLSCLPPPHVHLHHVNHISSHPCISNLHVSSMYLSSSSCSSPITSFYSSMYLFLISSTSYRFPSSSP